MATNVKPCAWDLHCDEGSIPLRSSDDGRYYLPPYAQTFASTDEAVQTIERVYHVTVMSVHVTQWITDHGGLIEHVDNRIVCYVQGKRVYTAKKLQKAIAFFDARPRLLINPTL